MVRVCDGDHDRRRGFTSPRRIGGGATPSQRNLLPFQKLIADRPPDEQRMFRELQEGLLEAETMRSANNAWPTPQALADDGIPPFAADPTQAPRYDWHLLQTGTLVNYLGIPQTATRPRGWSLVQEPEPGAPPDPTFEDRGAPSAAQRHDAARVHVGASRFARGWRTHRARAADRGLDAALRGRAGVGPIEHVRTALNS